MKLATCAQMREMDRIAIERYGIPGIVLMENAALAVVRWCKRLDAYAAKRVAVFCGTGNNGGDGFAIARHLHNDGADVVVIMTGAADRIKGDARVNYEICERMGVCIRQWPQAIDGYPLIIDAMLGTGAVGGLSGAVRAAVECINGSGAYVVAVDCPTGGDPDSGRVAGVCVKAGLTVTLALAKPGLLLYPLAEYAGTVEVGHISVPAALVDGFETGMYALKAAEAAGMLPKRRARSHKGTYGRAVIVAGSASMAGAAAFCARAAYGIGCGYVELCAPEGIIPVLQQLSPQAVMTTLAEKDGRVSIHAAERALERINRSTACLVGPGLGCTPEVAAFIGHIIKNAAVQLVIDADALNCISPECLLNAAVPPVITPHPLEMSRLTGVPVNEILDDLPGTARAFNERYGAITVLKDATTVIADNERVYINNGACSALAKAGAGDVLAGIITGLLCQGADAARAAALGVYVHSRSGMAAARRYGSYSVGCDELLECVHEVICEELMVEP